MRVRVWMMLLVGLCCCVRSASASAPGCRNLGITGEVRAGEPFLRPIGGGLAVWLQPIASGWILRMIPANGPLGRHDYAELATPPYQSVSPLSVSTDFAFRAQDAVGWNPRRFRFATSRASLQTLEAAYDRLGPARGPVNVGAERQLAAEIAHTSEGLLTILDARLSAGTADQGAAAAAVAAHFSRTAHTLEQPDGKGPTPLGALLWMRFRVDLELPPAFAVEPALRGELYACSGR